MESGTLLQEKVLSIWETLARAGKQHVQIFSTQDHSGMSERIYVLEQILCALYVFANGMTILKNKPLVDNLFLTVIHCLSSNSIL